MYLICFKYVKYDHCKEKCNEKGKERNEASSQLNLKMKNQKKIEQDENDLSRENKGRVEKGGLINKNQKRTKETERLLITPARAKEQFMEKFGVQNLVKCQFNRSFRNLETGEGKVTKQFTYRNQESTGLTRKGASTSLDLTEQGYRKEQDMESCQQTIVKELRSEARGFGKDILNGRRWIPIDQGRQKTISIFTVGKENLIRRSGLTKKGIKNRSRLVGNSNSLGLHNPFSILAK